MRELLGEKDNRRLHLIENIYLKPGIELSDLADSLGYSIMQTQIDIGFLNELIDPLYIEVTRDKKCFLEIPEALSTRVIYSRLLASNINFKVLESMLLNDFATYDQMAESLYISVATLKRVINFINDCFQKHDVYIKTRPLRIEGNENNIRAFFLFYLNERYIDDELSLPMSIQTFASELSDHYLRKFPKDTHNYSSVRRLKMYVSVSLLRETKAKNLNMQDLYSGSLKELIEIDVASYKNALLFKQVFKFDLNSEVYTRLFSYYLNDYRAFSIRDLNERVLKSNINKELYNQIIKVIKNISATFNIPIPNEDYLYYKLYNLMIVSKRISITPYAIYPNRKIFLLFNKSIPKDILNEARTIYNDVFSEIMNRNEAYFYEFIYILVTHWEGFYKTVSSQATPCKIALFFNSDMEHMRYMQDELKFQFNHKVKVELLDIQNLKELEAASKAYDLLIVNFVIPQWLTIHTKVISVTDALWTDKQIQIQNVINATFYNS